MGKYIKCWVVGGCLDGWVTEGEREGGWKGAT